MTKITALVLMFFVGLLGCGAEAPSSPPDKIVSEDFGALQVMVDLNVKAATDMHLITRLNLGTSVFDWYEPTPGKVIMAEYGLANQPTHRPEDGLTPVDIYKKLAPGKAVPKGLVDAQQRMADHMNDPTPEPPSNMPQGHSSMASPPTTNDSLRAAATDENVLATPGGYCSPPPPQNGYFDPQYFYNNACTYAIYQPWVATWCLWNRWNDAYYYCNSGYCTEGYGAVAAAIGNITMTMNSEVSSGQWTVAQGYWLWSTTGMIFQYFPPRNQHIWFNYNVNGPGSEFYFCGIMSNW